MRQSSKLLGVLVAVALVASCSGDDDDGAGTGGDFCEQAVALEALDQADAGLPTEEDLSLLEDWVAAAPEEIREDAEVLAGVVEELADLDAEDEDAFGAVFGLFLDPEVIAATEAVEAYLADECGIDVDTDTGVAGDPFDGSDDPSGADPGGEVGGAGDDDAVSLDALDAHLAEEGFEWVDDVTSSSLGTSPGAADVSLDLTGGRSLSEATEACEATVAYFSDHVEEVSVTVTLDGTEAVVADGGEDCEVL